MDASRVTLEKERKTMHECLARTLLKELSDKTPWFQRDSNLWDRISEFLNKSPNKCVCGHDTRTEQVETVDND